MKPHNQENDMTTDVNFIILATSLATSLTIGVAFYVFTELGTKRAFGQKALSRFQPVEFDSSAVYRLLVDAGEVEPFSAGRPLTLSSDLFDELYGQLSWWKPGHGVVTLGDPLGDPRSITFGEKPVLKDGQLPERTASIGGKLIYVPRPVKG